MDCFLFQPLTSIETCPDPATQLSDSAESVPSGTRTTSSEGSSPEVDQVVLKYKQHHLPQDLLQGQIPKMSLPTKPQSLLGSPKPSWMALKKDTRKQPLMSELFTKVPLREKLSLFPAFGNPKLAPNHKSGECQRVQACAKSLGDQSLSWRSAQSGLVVGKVCSPLLSGGPPRLMVETQSTSLESLWSY